jgi:geranylgeranyl reductase family protein
MTPKYDVIVIGSGPAGATAASILTKNNINTLLIEKEEFPRSKICGGAVSRRALLILEHENIKIPKLNTFKKCDSMQFGTFDFDSVENLANVRFDNEVAYLTDRSEFDHAIVKDAVSKGAELRQNLIVKNIEKENSQFTIKVNDFSFKSKYLLCADGVNSTSAKLLGFRSKWETDEVGLCIESHITDYDHPLSPLNFYFGGVKWGYAWFFDKGNHGSIGIGTPLKDASNLRKLFESFVKNCGYIKSIKNLKINAWRLPLTGGLTRNFVNENALLVGDAAGLVDPFLGEGIYYAIQSGKIAAECIINNKTNTYNEIIEKEITNNLEYSRVLVKLVKLDPKRFIKLLSNDNTIVMDYLEVMFGNSTYQKFLKQTFKKILLNPSKLF